MALLVLLAPVPVLPVPGRLVLVRLVQVLLVPALLVLALVLASPLWHSYPKPFLLPVSLLTR